MIPGRCGEAQLVAAPIAKLRNMRAGGAMCQPYCSAPLSLEQRKCLLDKPALLRPCRQTKNTQSNVLIACAGHCGNCKKSGEPVCGMTSAFSTAVDPKTGSLQGLTGQSIVLRTRFHREDGGPPKDGVIEPCQSISAGRSPGGADGIQARRTPAVASRCLMRETEPAE